MPASILLIAHVLNAILVFRLARDFATPGKRIQSARARLVALSLLWFLDACLLLSIHCSPLAIVSVVVVFSLAATTFPDELMRGLGPSLREKRFAVYLGSVFTTATLFFVHLPITTFLTSPGDLSIHLEYLVTTNASHAMAALYLAAVLYALAFSARLRSILTLTAFASLGLALINAYALPFGYPMMNGLMFEQVSIARSAYPVRVLVDVATVATVVALSVAGFRKFGPGRILVAIVLINVSLALASGAAVARDVTPVAQEAHDDASRAVNQPIRYARDKNNVLILFLDRFMGGFVEGILAQEPGLAGTLEGFTWYPRTLAPGENSLAGLHALLGGYDYTPREMNRRGQLIREVSAESYAILPHNFIGKGYEANLVGPHGLGFTVEGDCSALKLKGLACTHIPVSVTSELANERGVPMRVLADSRYADLLVLLGLMRGTPYLMRAVLYERGPWKPFLDHSAGTTFRQWAELKALPKLSSAQADRSSLNVVFNKLPHEPYFMGEDCVPRSTRLPAPSDALQRGHVSGFSYQHFVAARCTLLLVADYLRWMKDAGVYDNTKIVIASDHGIVGPVEDHSSRAVAGGTTAPAFVRSRSVLLVKERNARGALRTSEEFMPNAEVPRLVCEEIGGCVNPYLKNKTIAAHGRDLPFFVDFIPWQFNLQEPTRFKIEDEMVLEKRDPYDVHAWRGQPPE